MKLLLHHFQRNTVFGRASARANRAPLPILSLPDEVSSSKYYRGPFRTAMVALLEVYQSALAAQGSDTGEIDERIRDLWEQYQPGGGTS
ncbi:MAG: hypothetical protein DRJ61_12705 [Acidobacteria bacterium]|nr:MAG: hypothetical protein DRJ61_12705 [Acidobacteriota bacterium]